MHDAHAELLLVSVSGPQAIERRLQTGQSLVIGRRSTHGLILDRPEVSRDHAEFRPIDSAEGGGWVLVDLGSRHGSRVNGHALTPGDACPVQPGDIIEIAPWTLRLVSPLRNASMTERQVRTIDDHLPSHASMRTITAASADLAQERLQLLLDFAEAIGAAREETALARTVIEVAMRGTGFPNAAMLRPLMPDGTVSIIAAEGEIAGRADGAGPRLSRSLLREASHGQPVQMGAADMLGAEAHSIVALNIDEAICAPLMLEGAVAGFLYLDSRSDQFGAARRRVSPDAGAFAVGLCRLASLSLLNMMRQDLERRYARMEGEIAAAAGAQRLILPAREVVVSGVHVVGVCRPGRVVSGDFFDVIPLSPRRVAIALGDVAGKGVQASVLMTTTQGFLRGVLTRQGNVQQAANDLNAYLVPRCESGRFLSLWLGVLDFERSTLEYVNAGHGYAWLLREGAAPLPLTEAGGSLVGVVAGENYTTASVSIAPSQRLLLVSDGIIEQPRQAQGSEHFGWAGVAQAIVARDSPSEAVERLLAAVRDHAGQAALADDATIVIAHW